MAVCPACNARYEAGVTFCPKDGTQVVTDQESTDVGLVGQVIADRYRLARKLGEGGMGEVYEAQHIYIEKRVALKLLRPEIMSNTEAVTRFYQEARAASAIGHENIVQIDDFGKLPDGRVYLAMEYLQGQSLNDALQTPMALGRALGLIVQVCQGLAAAHAKGIVHRDMKPENVFITQHGGREVAKILDFGIAKVSGTEGNQHLTRTGTIFGTPHYMSPEQALGKALDQRSDIYSVGVIMYEMFTGQVPFKAESFMGILTQHITAAPMAPHEQAPERQIPLAVETIILKAMAKEPNDRYPTMAAVLDDLLRIQYEIVGGVPSPSDTVPQPRVTGALGMAGAAVGSEIMTTPRPAVPPTAPQSVQPWPSSGVPAPPGFPGAPPPPGLVPGAPGAVPAMAAYQPSQPVPLGAPAPRKGRGALIGGIIGAVVVLGAGGGAAWYFRDALMGAAAPPVPPQTDAAQPVVPPPPPPKPWGRVQLTSTPSGASILHDGNVEGQTPAMVKVPPDHPITYVLRSAGYEDKSLEIQPGESANKHVMLDKVHEDKPKPKPKRRPRPKPKPKPLSPYERLQ